MVRFSLGGAYRCGRGRPGPLHHPQGLEGVVVEALLREKALRGVQQQQVLTPRNRETEPVRTDDAPNMQTSQTNGGSHASVSHRHYHKSQAAAAFNCVSQSPNEPNDVKYDF